MKSWAPLRRLVRLYSLFVAKGKSQLFKFFFFHIYAKNDKKTNCHIYQRMFGCKWSTCSLVNVSPLLLRMIGVLDDTVTQRKHFQPPRQHKCGVASLVM